MIISFGLRTVLMTGVCRSGDRLWATIADALVLDYSSCGRTSSRFHLIMNYEFDVI